MSLFLALADTSFVESVTYVFVITVFPEVWMVRRLTAYPPVDTANAVAVSAIQTSEKESLRACACSSSKNRIEQGKPLPLLIIITTVTIRQH